MLGYYAREGPFGKLFEALAGRGVKRVGVTGLGTGALACYARPGEAWTFHEIDPEVVKLAKRWPLLSLPRRLRQSARSCSAMPG